MADPLDVSVAGFEAPLWDASIDDRAIAGPTPIAVNAAAIMITVRMSVPLLIGHSIRLEQRGSSPRSRTGLLSSSERNPSGPFLFSKYLWFLCHILGLPLKEMSRVRRVAIALPALNEADRIVACVAALLDQAAACAVPDLLSVHVLANNCRDGTADIVRTRFKGHRALDIREVDLLPAFAHAGGARRLAMDIAAQSLGDPDDLLLSTDADTVVAPDWLARMLPYFDQGYDAVAGRAVLRTSELEALREDERDRLISLGKYHVLLCYLRRRRADGFDAWPHHGYEGGASLALTLGAYDAIGGCPIVPVGEDRALFQAVRRAGGRIRHAVDVKAFTSGRLNGRAPGGMADTINQWRSQSGDDPIHETWPLSVELGHIPKSGAACLTFAELSAELALAQMLARSSRAPGDFELSA